MQCVHPISVDNSRWHGYGSKKSGYIPSRILVPCGKCIACRINKTREWKSRLIMESCSWKDDCFLTLTYDNEHLPPDAGLHKEHLQKFFKRLRRRLDEQGREIRYFAVGEYGDKFDRPHYHAIVFGLNPFSDDSQLVVDCWPFGNVDFGSVTPQSIGYVCGYVQKKLTGDASANYGFNIPPFQLASQHLGDDFVRKYADVLRDKKAFVFQGISYPLCDRHKDMIWSIGERKINELQMLDRSALRTDMDEELRTLERRMITKYNKFKQPSERRRWK